MSDPGKAARCPICREAGPTLHHDQGYRQLRRCSACGLVFAHPMPSRAEKNRIERDTLETEQLPEFAELYQGYDRSFKEDPVIREFRRGLAWIGTERAPGRLLDVGPGTGIFLFLAAEDFGWQSRGIDVSEEGAAKARAEFEVPVDVGDFETEDYGSGSFDCVTMLDVLEHTVDPTAFLARAFELLAPGGVLYVVVPNQQSLMTVLVDRLVKLGSPGKDFFLERLYVAPHVLYFNPRNLAAALGDAGFEVRGVKGGNVYLGRYRLPWWMRAAMELVLRAGGLVGMGAKVHALARKPSAAGAET